MKQPPYSAPDFSLIDTTGKTHSLTDYRGRWLVLYFYPKDDTPGCTVEACSFRDARDEILEQTGAEIIGISKDDKKSHEQFSVNHRLNFPLLSDPDGEVVAAYGAASKKMFGKEGVQRKTFIIDPEGVVQQVYGRVTPLGHGKQVADDLKRFEELRKANAYGGGTF